MSPEHPSGPLITLTTDLGPRDPYVASLKGVLRSLAPGTVIEDLTHEIAPQDLVETALFVAAAMPHFPPGTIHLVVVDPGVGGNRHPIVAEAGGQFFVCPDNGLLTLYLRQHPLEEARIITQPGFMRPTISPTFHGRDIFAPTAARLAMGARLDEAGDALDTLVTLDLAEPSVDPEGTIHGEIIHVDRFGNCVTNIERALLHPKQNYTVALGDARIAGLRETYAHASVGERLALFGSSDHLEVAVRNGNAAELLQVRPGAPVIVSRSKDHK